MTAWAFLEILNPGYAGLERRAKHARCAPRRSARGRGHTSRVARASRGADPGLCARPRPIASTYFWGRGNLRVLMGSLAGAAAIAMPYLARAQSGKKLSFLTWNIADQEQLFKEEFVDFQKTQPGV